MNESYVVNPDIVKNFKKLHNNFFGKYLVKLLAYGAGCLIDYEQAESMLRSFLYYGIMGTIHENPACFTENVLFNISIDELCKNIANSLPRCMYMDPKRQPKGLSAESIAASLVADYVKRIQLEKGQVINEGQVHLRFNAEDQKSNQISVMIIKNHSN